MVHLRQRGAPSRRTQVNEADEGGCGAHHPPQPTRTTWSWPTPTCPTESTPRFVRPVPSPTRRRSGLRAVRWSKHPLMFEVSTRNCWPTHSLPATFPGTQNARSLLGRPVRTVGTYSRLRRCGRSPALVRAASSDTTTVVEPDSRGLRSDAGSRVRRVGGRMAERSSAVRPAAVQLVLSG
jgi:hypothetical protein